MPPKKNAQHGGRRANQTGRPTLGDAARVSTSIRLTPSVLEFARQTGNVSQFVERLIVAEMASAAAKELRQE